MSQPYKPRYVKSCWSEIDMYDFAQLYSRHIYGLGGYVLNGNWLCPYKTCASVHSASAQQFIGVFNQSGDTLSQIKYHVGFMGQRIAPVTCLAFHPYKVCVQGMHRASILLRHEPTQKPCVVAQNASVI